MMHEHIKTPVVESSTGNPVYIQAKYIKPYRYVSRKI